MLKLLILFTFAIASTCAVPSIKNPRIRQIYTFPKNVFIENIAVRSNSDLILTSLSVPELYSIDPTAASPNASVIYTFPNSTGLMGVTETSPDVFVVVTGIWDLAATRAALGSLAVWTVNLRARKAVVSHVTNIANSTVLNGLATVPGSSKLVLAADSDIGAVWRVNVVTGAYEIAFSDPLFRPLGTTPGTNLGINGLRTSGRFLYFTNSAQGIFGRVAIDKKGDKVGGIEILARMPVDGGHYDDIAINSDAIWIATHPSHAVRVNAHGTQSIVADERLLNPTSAAFGRGKGEQRKTVYITNGGEFSGSDLINSGVVAITRY